MFAWHGRRDPVVADQRKASQWEFFVVPETELPADQQSIGLNPLSNLAQPCSYRSLANRVAEATPYESSRLKAQLHPAPEPCPHCRPAGA